MVGLGLYEMLFILAQLNWFHKNQLSALLIDQLHNNQILDLQFVQKQIQD